MENVKQIKAAVCNIQNELSRIAQLSEALSLSQFNSQDFSSKLITEFNLKLRTSKAKNEKLKRENETLRQKVAILELELEKKVKDSGKTRQRDRCLQREEPYIRISSKTQIKASGKIANSERREILIDSSPVKIDKEIEVKANNSSASKQSGPSPKNNLPRELTSSQFNMLPTQYSDASNQSKNDFELKKSTLRELSPKVESDQISSGLSNEEEADVIVDSQEEFEPLGNKEIPKLQEDSHPAYPSNYSALQRAEFLRTYYRIKLEGGVYVCDLSKNPVTEKGWALDDFVPNSKWRPKKRLNTNLGVMTNEQERHYSDFFKEAGYGSKPAGPKWTDTIESQPSQEEAGDWTKSQIMDKYLSPPGYMVGDFIDTQEACLHKAFAKKKEQERVQRRLDSALKSEEFIFYEDIFNLFVRAGRVKRHKD